MSNIVNLFDRRAKTAQEPPAPRRRESRLLALTIFQQGRSLEMRFCTPKEWDQHLGKKLAMIRKDLELAEELEKVQ